MQQVYPIALRLQFPGCHETFEYIELEMVVDDVLRFEAAYSPPTGCDLRIIWAVGTFGEYA